MDEFLEAGGADIMLDVVAFVVLRREGKATRHDCGALATALRILSRAFLARGDEADGSAGSDDGAAPGAAAAGPLLLLTRSPELLAQARLILLPLFYAWQPAAAAASLAPAPAPPNGCKANLGDVCKEVHLALCALSQLANAELDLRPPKFRFWDGCVVDEAFEGLCLTYVGAAREKNSLTSSRPHLPAHHVSVLLLALLENAGGEAAARRVGMAQKFASCVKMVREKLLLRRSTPASQLAPSAAAAAGVPDSSKID